ncbi:MAG: PAS domain S-box protein [Pirellulales bacterium]
MPKLRELSMNAKVLLLAGICSIGLLLFGTVSYYVVETSKIGSKHYEDIIQSEHLAADVLPPPGYILETYLNIHLMIDSTEAGSEALTNSIQKHFKLKKDHEECMSKWREILPDGELKQKLLKDACEPANAFYEMVENEIIPAIRNNEPEKAEEFIDSRLPIFFNQHSNAMNQVIQLVSGFEDQKIADAKSVVSAGSWLLWTIGAVVLAVIGSITYWLRSSIAKQEKVMNDYAGQVAAIGKSQAVIEFSTSGTITWANDAFLNAVGYQLNEIVGKHHSIFIADDFRKSAKYADFWPSLARGEYYSGEFFRIGKNGKEIWIQATYNPIFDSKGKVYKVVKFATDITARKIQDADYLGKVNAISASQAVIEFTPDGTVLTANENFCSALGYSLDEIKGKHHSLFVDTSFRQSPAYSAFWQKLRSGQFDGGEYKRITKSGKEIWIQATYNPVRDLNGKVVKVVKFATDITERKLKDADYEGQIKAISTAQAVIEFQLDGTILTANENFLNTVGYSLDELKGKHHRMFVEPAFRQTAEYAELWRKLGSGQFVSGEFKRIGKAGNEIYIQASYNPIFDMNGKPYKVVKYASDTTPIVREREALKRKVDQILTVVSAAAKGDLTQQITVSGNDPIGQLGGSLSSFFDMLNNSISSIGENATSLAGASEELSAVSTQMSANATQTASQAQIVSAATEEVNTSVSTVATGVDELNSAIREIAKNASDAARVSQQAVTIASDTNKTISKLGDSSMEIGKVVKVITSIAEQTNLLALNATIEAARAGEAGKGFAVVANEVKELAKETARATEDISHKIETIQADTNGAISAIQEICEVINRINDISNTIASAVEEQTATANEMGRNVSEAARGSAEIAQNITSVADATQSTTEGANNSMQAASELSRMASDLQRLVGQFKYHRDSLNSHRGSTTPQVQMTSFGYANQTV